MSSFATPDDSHLPLAACTPSERVPMVFAVVVFAAMSIYFAVTSEGFLEADACTHYLYARFAFAEPYYFVNVWGRPICTAVYALPALIGGRLGVRFMSLILALACGFTAYRIAKNQGYRRPVLALIFTLAQPLVFLHSFSELTELPFAALIGAAFLAYQTRRYFWMTLLVAVSPLGRPEGFGFILLAMAALIVHRKWWMLPILAMPLIAWNYAGWWMYGRQISAWPPWGWLQSEWPYAATSLYDRKPIYLFAAALPAIVGPFVFPATAIGIWRSFLPLPLGEGRGEGASNSMGREEVERPLTLALSRWERGKIQLLIAIIPLLILAGHSVLTATGKMASNGELRYMIVVAPFWGLLGAFGWEWIFERLNWKSAVRWAGVAALLPALVNLIYPVLPLGQMPDWRETKAIVQWYESGGVSEKYPSLVWAHPGISFYLDASQNDTGGGHEWTKRSLLEKMPIGTMVIWDPVYGVFNSDAKRSIGKDDFINAGWTPIAFREGLDKDRGPWWIFVSKRDAKGISWTTITPLPQDWKPWLDGFELDLPPTSAPSQ